MLILPKSTGTVAEAGPCAHVVTSLATGGLSMFFVSGAAHMALG